MTDDLLSMDKDLRKRFREGEQDALMQVWQAYYPLVRHLACRGFGPWRGFSSPADVDDAIAGTFAAAFEHNARLNYDGLTPYGAFLLGIGRNVMRRQMKKSAREPVHEPDSAAVEAADDDPEAALLSQEQRALLARFPDTLEPFERDVWLGYHRDGHSEEALAEQLNRTRYRVRKTLQKAEKRFRSYVKHLGLG